MSSTHYIMHNNSSVELWILFDVAVRFVALDLIFSSKGHICILVSRTIEFEQFCVLMQHYTRALLQIVIQSRYN